MLLRFYNEDNGYEKWCNENKEGFVFNFFGGNENRADMNKIHKVKCPSLWRRDHEGKRTTVYEKVCSSNLEELIDFVKSERGSSWSYCKSKHCFGV